MAVGRRDSETELSIMPVIVGRTPPPKKRTSQRHTYTAGFESRKGTGTAARIAHPALIRTRRYDPLVLYPPRHPNTHPPSNIPVSGAVKQVIV